MLTSAPKQSSRTGLNSSDPVTTGLLTRRRFGPHQTMYEQNYYAQKYPNANARPKVYRDFSSIPTLTLAAPTLQAKLEVNEPGDAFEQEADAVARQVIQMTTPRLQRKCGCKGGCEKCRKKSGPDEQKAAGGKAASAVRKGDPFPAVGKVLHSPGRTLDAETRFFMEARFGHDFGEVRIHTDETAAESALALQAKAFTVANHIGFARDRYSPGSAEGRLLLAHELTHTIQQAGGGSWNPNSGTPSPIRRSRVAVARQPEVMTPAHAGGAIGELDAAFILGQRGYDIVSGPGGPEGHGLTTHGEDIIAHNPKTHETMVVDNKASGYTSTVQNASAINENLEGSLTRAISRVQRMQNFPDKAAVLSDLQGALAAARSGKPMPKGVRVVVTNAGGYNSDISGKMKRTTPIEFEDLTGPKIRETRKRDIKKARAAGVKPGRPSTYPAGQAGAGPQGPNSQTAANASQATQGGPAPKKKTAATTTTTTPSEAEAKRKVAAKPKAKPKPKAKAKAKPKPKPKPRPKPKAKPKPKTEVKKKTGSKTASQQSEAERKLAESRARTQADMEAKTKAEAETKRAAAEKAALDAEQRTRTQTETEGHPATPEQSPKTTSPGDQGAHVEPEGGLGEKSLIERPGGGLPEGSIFEGHGGVTDAVGTLGTIAFVGDTVETIMGPGTPTEKAVKVGEGLAIGEASSASLELIAGETAAGPLGILLMISQSMCSDQADSCREQNAQKMIDDRADDIWEKVGNYEDDHPGKRLWNIHTKAEARQLAIDQLVKESRDRAINDRAKEIWHKVEDYEDDHPGKHLWNVKSLEDARALAAQQLKL